MIDPDDEPTSETMIVDVDHFTSPPAEAPTTPEPRDHGAGVLSVAYVQRIVIAATAERRVRLGVNAP